MGGFASDITRKWEGKGGSVYEYLTKSKKEKTATWQCNDGLGTVRAASARARAIKCMDGNDWGVGGFSSFTVFFFSKGLAIVSWCI